MFSYELIGSEMTSNSNSRPVGQEATVQHFEP